MDPLKRVSFELELSHDGSVIGSRSCGGMRQAAVESESRAHVRRVGDR
jgi:hypothetical protein